MVPNLSSFVFLPSFGNLTNSRVPISNMTTLFSNSSPKIHNSSPFGPRFRHFFSSQNLAIRKIESVDFKYDNSFFKILAQKYPNKAFLFPNLGIIVFLQNFAIRQI